MTELDANIPPEEQSMDEKDIMATIFQLAKENKSPKKITKKQEKTEEGKMIMRDRLKNAREKKKSMADRLQELERLLNEKTINEQKVEQPIVEKKVEEPIVEKKVEEPIVEQKVEQPVIKEPIVEQKVEEPVVEQKVEEPVVQIIEPPKILTREELVKIAIEERRREFVKKHFRI